MVAGVVRLVRGRVGKKVEMRAGPSCVIWKGSKLMDSWWTKGGEVEDDDAMGFNTVVGRLGLMLDEGDARASCRQKRARKRKFERIHWRQYSAAFSRRTL